MLGRFRIWVTGDSNPNEANLMSQEVEQVLLKPRKEWTAAETLAVKKYYLNVAPEFKKENQEIDKLRKAMPDQPRTLVLEERTRKRPSHLPRGEYGRPAEVVEPNVPSFLPPLPTKTGQNRLTFAKWLVDDRQSARPSSAGQSDLAILLWTRTG